jgi:hypothetical protein
MSESTTSEEIVQGRMSSHATLVGIGIKVSEIGLLRPITEKVHIAQKTVKYTPAEKLTDAFIAIAAGAHGLVEINKQVRPDLALQAAFGRDGCAEQSVVQDTLDACSIENVEQMHQACRHDFGLRELILDVDLTGRPCGQKAAFACKGYFEGQPNRRGRQVGYVVATQYEEIVTERVFTGKTGLTAAIVPIVTAAAQTLGLDADKRARTIIRHDAGGGSVEALNGLLMQGFQIQGKDYSAMRVKGLADQVHEWIIDPHDPGRQVGWVTTLTDLYCRPVRRIAVRCRKKNGQWGLGVILSTLSPADVLRLTGESSAQVSDPAAVLLAYVYFYDQRGGGVEIEIKEDKQGLGSRKRNKKRFPAQAIVVQLEALAHNVIVWARTWFTPHWHKVAHWGILRLVRDVFHVNGIIQLDHRARIKQIILNQRDPLARHVSECLAAILAKEQVNVILGEI